MDKHVLIVFSILFVLVTTLSFNSNASATVFDSVTLSELSQNRDAPIAQRVAATIQLGNISDQNSMIAIGRATRDETVELRLAAITAVEFWQDSARWDIISPLLNDNIDTVRFRAALSVVGLWPLLNREQQKMIDKKIEAYIATLAETDVLYLERAYLYRIRGKYPQAQRYFSLLLAENIRDPQLNSRIYLEYVELLRSTQRENEVIELLETVVNNDVSSSKLYFSLGLAYYRDANIDAAIRNMRKAQQLDADDARVSYTLALLLKETSPAEALSLMSSAYKSNPQPEYLYSLCELQLQQGLDANPCLSDLRLLIPNQIVDDLQSRNNDYSL